MRRLVGCRGCHRHVDERERACPFCRIELWPVVLVTALSLAGCKSTREPEPAVPPPDAAVDGSASANTKSLDELERDEVKKRLEGERPPRAVYGAPPPPRGSTGRPNCKCPPSDPLCTCF